MSKIFLSGGGDEIVSSGFDKLYKQHLSQTNKHILYIPRALYPHQYLSASQRIQKVFPKTQGYKITTLRRADKDISIKQYDGLYVGGGNTYRLLDLIRQDGFNAIIDEFISSNKPIYGGSAGAIIFGRDISIAEDINSRNLISMQGFNYIKDYSICCHFNPSKDQSLKEYVSYHSTPVIALEEGSGIYIYNNTYRTGGTGVVRLYHLSGGVSIISSGEDIAL